MIALNSTITAKIEALKSNGVPIENVSRMLGHKKLLTTQHYARVLNIKVSEDIQSLRIRLHKSM